MLRIILHSLRKRRVQSLATVASVAVGVAILFALSLLYLRVSLGVDAGKRRLGADLLVIPENSIVEPETLLFTGQPYNVYMPGEIEERIRRISGVRRATPQFFAQTLNETCCSLVGATRLIGFDQRSDWLIASWVTRLPGKVLAPDQVLVGSGVKGFSGQTATILKKSVRIAAVLEPTGTSLDYSILMPIGSTRSLVGTIPYFQVFLGEGKSPEDVVSALLVDVDADAWTDEVIKEIESLGHVRVVRASVILERLKQQMDILFLIMLGGGALAALASVLQLFGRFFSLAWDRKGEWGLYRALGATRRDLKLLVVGEAVILSGGGIVVGLIGGWRLQSVATGLLQSRNSLPLIDPSPAAVAAAGAGFALAYLLLALAAALIPALRSGWIEPTSAMALADID